MDCINFSGFSHNEDAAERLAQLKSAKNSLIRAESQENEALAARAMAGGSVVVGTTPN